MRDNAISALDVHLHLHHISPFLPTGSSSKHLLAKHAQLHRHQVVSVSVPQARTHTAERCGCATPEWSISAEWSIFIESRIIIYLKLFQPPNMPKSIKYTESDLLKACEAAQAQKKPNFTKIAREYGVPLTTLRGRVKNNC
jgi:hypothetical protein